MTAEVARFIDKYTPGMARAIAECRAKMHVIVPRGFELVYDNYNALVFAMSPSERTSEAMVSIAAYPRWVTLFFLKGKELADPQGLLQGDGVQVRSIRLRSPADLDTAPVQALIAQALAAQAPAFAQAPALRTVVKSVSAKQRPRRPAVVP